MVRLKHNKKSFKGKAELSIHYGSIKNLSFESKIYEDAALSIPIMVRLKPYGYQLPYRIASFQFHYGSIKT